ncbi:MAG: peptidoglycan-binding protein [Clostridia bacterium]|nr:peptidoglycan-binding protein [Clostridia bacterium]
MRTGFSKAGLVLLILMFIVALCLGAALWQIANQALIEARTTPTPLPQMTNVMAVTPDPNAPTPEPLLRTGMLGDEVTKLQRRLFELNYYHGLIDGQFGPGTRDAVILFQQKHGLEADGVVGPATKELLYSGQAFKYVAE